MAQLRGRGPGRGLRGHKGGKRERARGGERRRAAKEADEGAGEGGWGEDAENAMEDMEMV